jgi:hypothetical protein
MDEIISMPDTYNPNLLVTYKDINNGEATYPTIKVNDLEWKLERAKRTVEDLQRHTNTINQITSNLTANGWYNPNVDKEDILSQLCEILNHEPKQSVRITATVNVEVDYEIPLEEVEDFDARYFLQDNLSIDSWHGDVTVESFDVEDADVDWD